MLDKKQHLTILVKIIKEIYSDAELARNLVFKGGTALYLFYNLPRLSVDLDFDLINPYKKDYVFKKIKEILKKFGKLQDASEKRFTLFFLLSYEKKGRNIKVEISKRGIYPNYEVKHYLGIPVLVATKECLSAGKLSAFLTRKKFATRDLFDLWFILKNNFKFDEEYLKKLTEYDLPTALKKAITKLKTIKRTQLLQGIGELIEEKQKNWIKEKLKSEVEFYLKLYLKSLEKANK